MMPFGLRRLQLQCLIIMIIITLAILCVYNNLNKDSLAGMSFMSPHTPTYENSTSEAASESWKQRLIHESKNPQKIGSQISSSNRKFLSIGIPTVYRKENYLKQTLTSFINESTAEQRENVVIILYLADSDFQKKNTQIEMIRENFQEYLDSGFLQIIYSASSSIHPPLNFTSNRRTYSDSVTRVQWRAKQALDFAFLLSFASDSSKYFMVMEDDILAAPQYITSIRNFIELKSEHQWIALEFTEFVGIGLLFHASDLNDIANFLLLFYEDQPVDFLLREFIRVQVPDEWSVKRLIPSIFQHFGTSSTLEKKSQTIIDLSFETAKRKYQNQNPPANLTTTMKIHEDCFLENAYQELPGIFWGLLCPHNKTEHIDIIFQSPPILVQRIVILTGMITKIGPSKNEYKDFIEAGHVQFSDAKGCGNYKPIDEFKDGSVDYTFILPTNITCLQIVIPNKSSWIVSKAKTQERRSCLLDQDFKTYDLHNSQLKSSIPKLFMFPKFGKKKADTQDEEEIFLISEEDLEDDEKQGTGVGEGELDRKDSSFEVIPSQTIPSDDSYLSSRSSDVDVTTDYTQLLFDRFPMFPCSRTIVKTIVKFFLNLTLKLWKWASTFVIAIFFVSWFYGGIYPYVVCFIAILSLGYQISDTLIYQPDSPLESRVLVSSPSQYSLPYEAVTIQTKDRVKLHAYLIKQQKFNSRNVPTVIYFHGNAGNIGHRLDNTKIFFNKVKCNTLLVEYRGYGLSEGSPSEAGFYLDSQAAFDFVDERSDLDSSKIILFGRSLGGAVAIDLASRCDYRDRIAALVIENTFTSIPELAKVLFPIRVVGWIPKFCFKNRYDSAKKIEKVVCPTLFICGEKDELIPPRMTSELHIKCSTEVKNLKRFANGGHNDTWLCKDYQTLLTTFINESVASPVSISCKAKPFQPYGDNIV